MPVKKGSALMDPVAAIARGIVRCDREGHADQKDFVLVGVELLDLERTDALEAVIDKAADDLFEDSGETIKTEQQMAAFIYARLMVTS